MTISLRSFAGALFLAFACLAPASPAAADFPPGFLWGTAISGFQAETGGVPTNGDPASDWWVWVHDATNINAGNVSGQLPEDGPGFWNHFAGDLETARRRAKTNAFRMNIEWSRIFPTSTAGVDASGGITLAVLQQLDAQADQAAVSHYREVLQAVHAQGMTPFMTLVHFTLPLWIHDPIAARDALAASDPNLPPPTGFGPAGWLEPAIVPEFAKFAAYAAWKFGDQVDLWAPQNEPFVVILNGYTYVPGVAAGYFPPGALSYTGGITATTNQALGNAAAYDAIKLWDTADANGDGTNASVGLVHSLVYFVPLRDNEPADAEAAVHADYIFNRIWLNATIRGDLDLNVNGTIDPGEHHPELVGKADFIGVNYYLRNKALSLGGPVTPVLPLFDFAPTGQDVHPEGMRHMLNLAGEYGLPVYVTENGSADAADDVRNRHILNHVAAVERAIGDGVDVRGFFYWTLIDNFEWSHGYSFKFGLFSYEPVTMERTLRQSGRIYGRIARRNRIPLWLRRRF